MEIRMMASTRLWRNRGPFAMRLGMLLFPQSTVSHLLRLKLDHSPLYVSLRSKLQPPRGCPFRFLAGWVEHPTFSDFVK
ncbi:hypothetical protein J1N35_007921 [Gossypium stocksii]|uniref:Uncharacterized protein n=1 Tax=Gossypium stocksii TaxID=47602 RepID=A0A9D3W9F4_9ROSI|nr:hypothetical protein J1N35_007921 [Gossypium stocksii]